jgi:hypothetical protein
MRAAWTALCVLVSLIYLTGEVTKSLLAAAFVLGSSYLGVASYRLAQLGVVMSIVAFAVAFGFPQPSRWLEVLAALVRPSVVAAAGG